MCTLTRRLALVIISCSLADCVTGDPPDDVGTIEGPAQVCDPSTFVSFCTSNTLKTCEGGIQVTRPCGSSICNAARASCGYCGDGVRDPAEQCDDANANDWDACRSSCTLNATCNPASFVSVCRGNALVTCVGGYEATAPCGARTCNAAASRCGACGDGVIDPGEDCDDANGNDWDACRADCTDGRLCDPLSFLPRCDGNTLFLCDHGVEQPLACGADAACDAVHGRCGFCGDGVRDPGEDCDGSEGCTVDCELVECRSHADCADDDPCTREICDADRRCDREWIDGCCHTSEQCPGDACHTGVCHFETFCALEPDFDACPELCTAGKVCDGACVPTSSAATGCGGAGCGPCPAVIGGIAVCDAGACATMCDDGLKLCGGACVPSDVDHGCGAASCAPCPGPAFTGAHATGTPICDASGRCDLVCLVEGSPGVPCEGGCCGCDGSGTCDLGENLESCPEDCSCGNGQCEPDLMFAPEDWTTCPQDCTCGNGVCDPNEQGVDFFDTETYCQDDCFCGNGTCDYQNGEEGGGCVADCPGTCEPNEKMCGGVCVSLADPTHGCARQDCAPCPSPAANGQATCVFTASFLHVCASTCDSGYAACDGACVRDPAHGCGAASCQPCSFPHVQATVCSASGCDWAGCAPGWENIDGDKANGCETATPELVKYGMAAWWRTDLDGQNIGVTPTSSSLGTLWDQSGNGNHLGGDIGGVPNIPTTSPYLAPFNGSGRQCLFFEGRDWPLTKAFNLRFTQSNLRLAGSDYTVIAVVGTDTARSDNWFFGYGRVQNGSWCGLDPEETCPNTHMFMGFWQPNLFHHEQWLNAITPTIPVPVAGQANAKLVIARLDRTTVGGERSLRINEVYAESPDRRPMANQFIDIVIGGTVGSYNFEPTPPNLQRFRGWFCEMLIYARGLTQSEQTTVNTYLRKKWKIPVGTP